MQKPIFSGPIAEIPKNDFLKLTLANETNLSPFKMDHQTHTIEVWDTGVIHISPKNLTGKCERALIYSSAIHGNETAPIEICNQIITSILEGSLSPIFPVLFIFGNPAAININKRFVEENMNRLFSNKHSHAQSSNQEKIRAKKLEGYVTDFYQLHDSKHKIHYDLHTAIRDSVNEKFAVCPYTPNKPWKKLQFEILRSMGVSTFLLMNTPATTFSYYTSSNHGADSFTIELGKVRPFGMNDPAKFRDSKQTLINLLTTPVFTDEHFELSQYQMMSVHRTILKHHEDFELAFADDTPNFTAFDKGDILAREDGKMIRAELDGEAIIFPNAQVTLGERAILTVIEADIANNLI